MFIYCFHSDEIRVTDVYGYYLIMHRYVRMRIEAGPRGGRFLFNPLTHVELSGVCSGQHHHASDESSRGQLEQPLSKILAYHFEAETSYKHTCFAKLPLQYLLLMAVI